MIFTLQMKSWISISLFLNCKELVSFGLALLCLNSYKELLSFSFFQLKHEETLYSSSHPNTICNIL